MSRFVTKRSDPSKKTPTKTTDPTYLLCEQTVQATFSLAKELNVTLSYAALIHYYTVSGECTPELKQELIEMCHKGIRCPEIERRSPNPS